LRFVGLFIVVARLLLSYATPATRVCASLVCYSVSGRSALAPHAAVQRFLFSGQFESL